MTNRIIKFRVWNGEQMIYPDYIDREGYAHWSENSIPEISNKLMQFTGLLDKNGKEIYEGDILSGEDNLDKSPMVVCWDDENLQWVVKRVSDKDKFELWYVMEESSVKEPEVIGNIYENPELLK